MRQQPIKNKTKRRIQIILILVSMAFAGLFCRLIWIQLFKGEELQKMAYESRFRDVEIEAKRGVISDRKGRPLAISITTDSFYANPPQIEEGQEAEIAAQLSAILGISQTEILNQITKEQAFVWIQRKVDKDKAEAIKKLDIKGVHSVEEPERVYPKGTLLANVLGFVGMDNNGLNGVEASYDKVLSGTPGTLMVEYDSKNQRIPEATQKYIAPEDGSSLALTIDETIQYIAERELKKMVETSQPDRAGILVMEPKTGRILAMAESPTFDPNAYNEYDENTWKNFLISDVYEPGSTFKTVVMSGALEEGVVRLQDSFYCGGAIKVKGGTIRCWRTGHPHGNESFAEGVQNSCNPVFVTIGLKMGQELFYKYLNGFGFGQKTGIDLPGEGTGLVVSKDRCTELDLATMSIGQANAVTPIQLLTAFCAISNGGNLMKPQIVQEIRDASGNVIETIEPEVVRKVISSETSKTVMTVLETVVSQGTGKTAYTEGYRAGGKTGTAQKIIPGGGYSATDFIPSFMGVAPTNDPQIVCLVIADNPKVGPHTGSAVCAPVFHAVVRDTLSYLKVPTQVIPEQVSASSLQSVLVPAQVGKELAAAVSEIEQLGLKASVIGEGTQVIAQLPLAGTQMLKGNSVVLYTHMPKNAVTSEQIPVPELTGKTKDEILKIAQDMNLDFEVIGEGIAMYQDPAPGTMTAAGSKVSVHLEEEKDPMNDPLDP